MQIFIVISSIIKLVLWFLSDLKTATFHITLQALWTLLYIYLAEWGCYKSNWNNNALKSNYKCEYYLGRNTLNRNPTFLLCS